MTTAADRNDLMPAQEKLEWVTPKILLMEAEDTEGNLGGKPVRQLGEGRFNYTRSVGPS